MGNRSVLTNEQWEGLALVLAGSRRRGPRTKSDHRFIQPIVWLLRTGAPWRDLPGSFGEWSTVYQRFRRWAVAGRREMLRRALAAHDGSDEVLLIDSTFVKAFLACVEEQGMAAVIPSRANRKIPRPLDVAAYAHRNVIERFFGRVNSFRRVATRYDKTAASYASSVALVTSLLVLAGWKP